MNMEKYSIELTLDELVRVIEGLGLLIDEAHEEQDKEKFHNASVLRRQLLEVADGELAEFGGHPELVPTGEEPDEKPDRLERYFKGMLGEIPERLRNVEVIERSWSVLNEMWVLGVPRDPSLKEVQALVKKFFL